MCGINGLVSDALGDEQKLAIVSRMNERLAHRGPDNQGSWKGQATCLGHTRLSIIDLHPEGNQPFSSTDDRYVLVYNGELYNYREIKLELQRATHGSSEKPYIFRTSSDTEVVLAAFMRWGTKCVDRFNGMFAFALYDRVERKLTICRDRLGVKPLYYYAGPEGLIFASEIRAILHSGIRKFTINHDAIPEYAMYQTVFAPDTIISGIRMLMPGHYAVFSNGSLDITRYYDVCAIRSTPPMTYRETCDKVHELLSLSVQRRLVADVPFGAFLSGGIDSSAIVGLMSSVSSSTVQTFNVSFDESEFSESHYARLIAKKFRTEHHEIRLTAADFLNDLPGALSAMDHPGGDGPNTYVVSKATKKAGITMALSGIGGDELFAGYDVFRRMTELNRRSWLNAVPLFVRKGAGFFMERRRLLSGGAKIAELLSQAQIDFLSAYPLNRSIFTARELARLFPGSAPAVNIRGIISRIPQIEERLLSAVSLAEINTYMQNTLLRDTDQMSMAVALEVREPFLDHQLVEFVLSVPDSYKYPHTPKKLLVDSLGDLLPGEVVYRKKMGFTLPWEHWMRNELRSFCEKQVSELCESGLLDGNALKMLWERFLGSDPTVKWSRLWHLIVLNNWITENGLRENG